MRRWRGSVRVNGNMRQWRIERRIDLADFVRDLIGSIFRRRVIRGFEDGCGRILSLSCGRRSGRWLAYHYFLADAGVVGWPGHVREYRLRVGVRGGVLGARFFSGLGRR